MERSQFVKNLETCAPALAQNELVPVMQRFWFTGQKIIAFNDQIAIWRECETEFKGSVPGYFLDLVKATNSTRIEIEAQDNYISVKGDGRLIKLELQPPEQFREFTRGLPNQPRRNVSLKEHRNTLVRAFECCLQSVSTDTSLPEHLGITCSNKQNGDTTFYATNGKTIAFADVKIDGWPLHEQQVILPTQFCTQLIALIKQTEHDFWVNVTDDYALLETKEATLFGRLLASDRPLDFESIIERHWPKKSKFVSIPDDFASVINRATIITDSKLTRARTAISVNNRRVELHSKSDRGEVRDQMTLGADHPNVATTVNPQFIKDGIESYSEISISRDCCILRTDDKNHVYMIAALTGE